VNSSHPQEPVWRARGTLPLVVPSSLRSPLRARLGQQILDGARELSGLPDVDGVLANRRALHELSRAAQLLLALAGAGPQGELELDLVLAPVLLAAAHEIADVAPAAALDAMRGALELALAPPPHVLTARELQVLQLLAGGASYAEIALRLVIDLETVRTHARRVRRKLGVATSRELRGWADVQ
jgi:DNA-binding CsgD family transcriptional regulator